MGFLAALAAPILGSLVGGLFNNAQQKNNTSQANQAQQGAAQNILQYFANLRNQNPIMSGAFDPYMMSLNGFGATIPGGGTNMSNWQSGGIGQMTYSPVTSLYQNNPWSMPPAAAPPTMTPGTAFGAYGGARRFTQPISRGGMSTPFASYAGDPSVIGAGA